MIETERLILRPWREDDAEGLFEYSKNPNIGPPAGWPVHTSVENSLEIIRKVLAVPDTFAVTLKGGDDRAIGSAGLFPQSVLPEFAGETEVGYWIAEPFWGQGLIPEVVCELLRICFEDRGQSRVWCGHYEGNDKSRRVVEKCGFKFVSKQEVDVPLLGERRMEHHYCITAEEFRAL